MFAQVMIYCEAGHTAESLRKKAQEQFGIIVAADITLVPLTSTHLLLPERWPRLTLLTQALASLVVAWEGLRQAAPQVRPRCSKWVLSALARHL
jgi:alpha-1,2-mannosyltransferase